MFRTLYLALVLVAAALAAAVFTYLNDGDITLDIAFAEVTVSISFAFAVAIAIGWALGWLSAAVVLARAKADQFLLKRRLRHTRNELRDAKRLPGLD